MSETEIQNHDEDIKLYELGFNLVSSIAESELDKEFISLKDIITKHKGSIVSESNPTLIDLAYTMIKNIDSKRVRYDQAYFGWVKFNAFPDVIEGLKDDIEDLPSVLRFMILNASEEGNISSQTVARAISGEVEEVVEKKDEASEDNKETPSEESKVEEKAPEAEEPKADVEKIDDAIDTLVEESK